MALPVTAFALLSMHVAVASDADWPAGEFNPYEMLPIVYHLETQNLSDRASGYADSFRSAFRWWEAGGNGALSWDPAFGESESADSAHIRISFVESTFACGTEGWAGCAAFGGPRYANSTGTIEVATLRPRSEGQFAAHGGHLSFRDMENLAKHEIGHAIGLDHVDDPADIMHPDGDSFSRYSDSPDTTWAVKNIGWLMLGFLCTAIVAAWVAPSLRWRR